ncbi:MAG: PIG-L family deacetylase [Pirellulaceae bacterium]|nr:PIG-L family deacetylase [Pirellulaceae bacterium]
MADRKVALACMAHPDDAEFTCGGVLALLHEVGWQIHIATLTPGDCGSERLGAAEISRIRREEAAHAASVLDGTYHCLERRDGFIAYDEPTIRATVALVREVQPLLLFAHAPHDYLIDHEVASSLARNAAFFAGVPNLKTERFGPFRPVPYVYYVDPVEGKDLFGTRVEPTTVVDIGRVIDVKARMLACHASQREWLLQQHGMDEYIEAMKAMSRRCGELIGVDYAEGCRQHLGHGYPQDNLLVRELGDVVHARSA